MEAAVHAMPVAGPCDFEFVPDPKAKSGCKRSVPGASSSSAIDLSIVTNEGTGERMQAKVPASLSTDLIVPPYAPLPLLLCSP
jgi:hypothetical protein